MGFTHVSSEDPCSGQTTGGAFKHGQTGPHCREQRSQLKKVSFGSHGRLASRKGIHSTPAVLKAFAPDPTWNLTRGKSKVGDCLDFHSSTSHSLVFRMLLAAGVDMGYKYPGRKSSLFRQST